MLAKGIEHFIPPPASHECHFVSHFMGPKLKDNCFRPPTEGSRELRLPVQIMLQLAF